LFLLFLVGIANLQIFLCFLVYAFLLKTIAKIKY